MQRMPFYTIGPKHFRIEDAKATNDVTLFQFDWSNLNCVKFILNRMYFGWTWKDDQQSGKAVYRTRHFLCHMCGQQRAQCNFQLNSSKHFRVTCWLRATLTLTEPIRGTHYLYRDAHACHANNMPR